MCDVCGMMHSDTSLIQPVCCAPQVAFLAAHRAAWEVDILEKKRLSVMMDEKAAFQVGCLTPHGKNCMLTKYFFQLAFEKMKSLIT